MSGLSEFLVEFASRGGGGRSVWKVRVDAQGEMETDVTLVCGTLDALSVGPWRPPVLSCKGVDILSWFCPSSVYYDLGREKNSLLDH